MIMAGGPFEWKECGMAGFNDRRPNREEQREERRREAVRHAVSG